MIPVNTISVRVQAPFRGLSSEWPEEIADMTRRGDRGRVFTVAENVRFRRGSVMPAPSLAPVGLFTSLEPDVPFVYDPNDPFQNLFQIQSTNQSGPSLFLASRTKLYKLTQAYLPDLQDYVAILTQVAAFPQVYEHPLWSVVPFYKKILISNQGNPVHLWDPAWSASIPLPGLDENDSEWEGIESVFNHVVLWSGERIKWSAADDYSLWIPVGETASTFLATAAAGFLQPAPNNTVSVSLNENVELLGWVPDMFVRATATASSAELVAYYRVAGVNGADVLLELLPTTSTIPTGTDMPSGTVLEPLVANSAGEANITGSGISGPILRILVSGNYAYIFKEQAVLSLQYDPSGGGFFINREYVGLGPLSPSAVVSMGDGSFVFLTHAGLFSYGGGRGLVPIGDHVVRQSVLRILDRARLNQVRLLHNEPEKEVLLAYPILGGKSRLLIWNYETDSLSIDILKEAYGTVTGLASVTWDTSSSWQAIDPPWSEQTATWTDMRASILNKQLLICAKEGSLMLSGAGVGWF